MTTPSARPGPSRQPYARTLQDTPTLLARRRLRRQGSFWERVSAFVGVIAGGVVLVITAVSLLSVAALTLAVIAAGFLAGSQQ